MTSRAKATSSWRARSTSGKPSGAAKISALAVDVVDFIATRKPDDPMWSKPFIMQGDGAGALFASNGGINDAPFPEHFEPWESPTENKMNKKQFNPIAKIFNDNKSAPEQYPIIATTYRVVEHWQTGALTRNLPWLAELMPNMFVELSEELAAEKEIENGDTCHDIQHPRRY